MLFYLSIKNFRSIKSTQVLSLLPFKRYKEHPNNIFETQHGINVLKTSVIYGPNASGKSNVLKALKAVEYLLINSTDFKLGDKIPPYEPFRLDKNNLNQPVEIEISFKTFSNNRYKYYISFTDKNILEEKLSFFPNRKEALLFHRVKSNKIRYGDYYKGDRKNIENQLIENQLFLSRAANSNVEQLRDVYLYFKERVHVIPFLYGGMDNKLKQLYAKRFVDGDSSRFKKLFNKLISSLDTGIHSIDVDENDESSFQFPDNFPSNLKDKIISDFKYDIKTEHDLFSKGKKTGKTYFDISDESDGTQRLFILGGLILDALEDGTLLIVDEFEKNLHPHITKFLINLFNSKKLNPKRAQLIFATHDISQIDPGIFRRDQIWFTKKDEKGATSLYSLSDFSGVRRDIPLEKWYDSGRFDAIPNIKDLELELEVADE